MFRRAVPAFPKQHVKVLGADMAYADIGSGRPVVFLHGNPTHSYLWRNVIFEVSPYARCIALDLIGMGDSAKVGSGPRSYRFIDHRTYLDAFLEVLGIYRDVVIVGHDWGGALGFDWANRHRPAVRGIAYLETIVMPLTWDDWPEESRRTFTALRSPIGDEMILEKNIFVERILPASVIRPLPDEIMAEYRRPFLEKGEGRRPTLTWPREIPIDGEPAKVVEVVESYGQWLAESDVRKLFINGEPGSILVGRAREFCRTWPNQTEVTVPGIHFLQEDSGHRIGRAIADWLF